MGNDVNSNYVIKARENKVVYIHKLSLIYNFWRESRARYINLLSIYGEIYKFSQLLIE